jgi:hypothetical protein
LANGSVTRDFGRKPGLSSFVLIIATHFDTKGDIAGTILARQFTQSADIDDHDGLLADGSSDVLTLPIGIDADGPP